MSADWWQWQQRLEQLEQEERDYWYDDWLSIQQEIQKWQSNEYDSLPLAE